MVLIPRSPASRHTGRGLDSTQPQSWWLWKSLERQQERRGACTAQGPAPYGGASGGLAVSLIPTSCTRAAPRDCCIRRRGNGGGDGPARQLRTLSEAHRPTGRPRLPIPPLTPLLQGRNQEGRFPGPHPSERTHLLLLRGLWARGRSADRLPGRHGAIKAPGHWGLFSVGGFPPVHPFPRTLHRLEDVGSPGLVSEDVLRGLSGGPQPLCPLSPETAHFSVPPRHLPQGVRPPGLSGLHPGVIKAPGLHEEPPGSGLGRG